MNKANLAQFCLLVLLAAGNSQAGSSGPPDDVPPLPSPFVDRQSYTTVLQNGRERCSDENCRRWYDYVLGKFLSSTDAKRACEIFTDLSEKTDFPAHLIAFIHRAEACAYDSTLSFKTLTKIKESLEKEKPKKWVEGALSEAGLRSALQSPQNDALGDIFSFSLAASSLSHSKKLRSEYLEKALDATKDEASKDPQWVEKRNQVEAELYRISPSLKPVAEGDNTPETWFGIGTDSLALHDFEASIRAFQKVLNFKQVPVPLKRADYESLKTSFKALQKKKEAFDVSKKLYLWELSLFKSPRPPADEPKHLLSGGLTYARFLWTDHESKKALVFLKNLERLLKKTSQNLSELYFIRARINEELRKTRDAVAWMKKATAGAESSAKGIYGWSSAWLNYKENNFTEAQKQFEDLLTTETDPGRRAQEMYWLSQTDFHLNKPEERQRWLETLLQEDPFGYYALLAYRDLGREIPKAVQWLVSLGEIHWAQAMLDDEYPLLDASLEADTETLQAYAEAAYFAPLFIRFSKIPPAEKEKILALHPEFVFPRPYRNSIEEASSQSGLDPSYISAIMRQESSFDPLSISGANAYGLMQLLPSVAQSLAAKSGAPYHKPEDLLDPVLNIILGAQHLRNYWEEFDGQFILVTAAYNASPETVKTWVRTRFQGDPLMFIEDVPYDETRVYVKLVLRNFINYLRLNSSGPVLNFPEWCLEGIHASKD